MLFAQLYKDLIDADTRNTRSDGRGRGRGRGRGVQVGGRVSIRSTIAPTTGGEDPSLPRVFVRLRRGSSSSAPVQHDDVPYPREPEFDSDGNLLSDVEEEEENPSSPEDSSSENSLDDHSDEDESNSSSDTNGDDSDP